MKRATLQDVADLAGVSYATADRVLNARGQVAEKSRTKVERAVQDLAYVRDDRAANLARSREYRFVFLIPDGAHDFFDSLKTALAHRVPGLLRERVTIDLRAFPAFDTDGLVRALQKLDAEKLDGVALIANQVVEVAQALQNLTERGVHVVTLVADAAEEARAAFVGPDNHDAGRLAASLIALAHRGQSGRVQPLIGAVEAQDHAARLVGFTSRLSELNLDVEVLPALTTGDDPERCRQIVIGLSDDITGIYNAGGGNAGLLNVFTNGAKRPAIAVHELDATTCAGLQAHQIDAVIDQKPAEEIDAAITILRRLADGQPVRSHIISPAIYMADNLPIDPDTNI